MCGGMHYGEVEGLVYRLLLVFSMHHILHHSVKKPPCGNVGLDWKRASRALLL